MFSFLESQSNNSTINPEFVVEMFQLFHLLQSSHLCPPLLFQLQKYHPLSSLPLFDPHRQLLKNLSLYVNVHNDYNEHFVIPIFLMLIFINMQPLHPYHSQELIKPDSLAIHAALPHCVMYNKHMSLHEQIKPMLFLNKSQPWR